MGTFRRRFDYRAKHPRVRSAPVTNDAYATVVLATPDLAGYWRLGEPSGTNVADSSGGGYDLTTVNSPTRNQTSLLPTITDPSTDFNGSTQYANRAATPSGFHSAGAISIECWVNGDTTGNKCPFGLFGSSSDKGIWFNFQTALQLYGSIDGSAQTTCSSGVSTVTGQTYHLVGTHDGSNLRIYVDGVLKTTTALAGTLHTVTTSGGLAIGRLGALSSDYFDGRVDEAAVYKRALSGAEVLAHYNAGTSTSTYTSPVVSIALSAKVPSVSEAAQVTSPLVAIALSAKTPSVNSTINTPSVGITLSALAPSISVSATGTTPLVAIALSAKTPTINFAATTPVVGIVLNALTPTFSTATAYTSPLVNITLSALAPSVSATAQVTSPVVGITLSAKTPSISVAATGTTPLVAIALSAKTPSVNSTVNTPLVAIALSAKTPSINVAITSPKVGIVLNALTPSISVGVSFTSPLVSILLSAKVPSYTETPVGVGYPPDLDGTVLNEITLTALVVSTTALAGRVEMTILTALVLNTIDLDAEVDVSTELTAKVV